jgi:hypothetical protein
MWRTSYLEQLCVQYRYGYVLLSSCSFRIRTVCYKIRFTQTCWYSRTPFRMYRAVYNYKPQNEDDV